MELPLIYRGLPAGKRRLLALEALERVGLASRMDHRPNQMSGGQQQRVAVARAIAAHPPLILADEPTGNLDTRAGARVFEIIRALHVLSGGQGLGLGAHVLDLASSRVPYFCASVRAAPGMSVWTWTLKASSSSPMTRLSPMLFK